MNERRIQAKKDWYDAEINQARRHLKVQREIYDREITKARNDFEARKKAAADRVMEARQMLRRITERRRQFLKYHEEKEL